MSKYLLFLKGVCRQVIWKRPKTPLRNIKMVPYWTMSMIQVYLHICTLCIAQITVVTVSLLCVTNFHCKYFQCIIDFLLFYIHTLWEEKRGSKNYLQDPMWIRFLLILAKSKNHNPHRVLQLVHIPTIFFPHCNLIIITFRGNRSRGWTWNDIR